MSNTVFKKWTDAVSYLNEKFKTIRVIAGRNIQLEDTGHGIRINSCPDDFNGNAYKGYFKVINSSDDTTSQVKVINGSDYKAAKCGWTTINDTNFELDVKELEISDNTFIYLQAVYDVTTDTTGTPTFEQSSSYPEYEANKIKYLIATVSYSDDAISGIIQQHNNGAIIGQTFGDCE